MIINYLGKQFFKIQVGDTTLAYNPISQDSKTKKVSRFGADLAVSSMAHPDYNGFDTVTYGDKEPFIINGPGAYETMGIDIKGVGISFSDGKDEYINTVYTIVFDGIRLCMLGSLAAADNLSDAAKEEIGEVDILTIPVSGNPFLPPVKAFSLARSLAPAIVIPTELDGKDSPELKEFIDEAGKDKVERLDKLTIKKSNVLNREMDVIILSS